MSDYTSQIKRINMLQRILEQDVISLKKSFGDPEVLEEIDKELREYVAKLLNKALGGSTSIPDGFTSEQYQILVEFANKMITKVATPAKRKEKVAKPTTVKQPLKAPPAVPKGKNPIVAALEAAGAVKEAGPKSPEEVAQEADFDKWVKEG